MTSLKPETYSVTRKKVEKTKLITLFCFVLSLFLLFFVIPTLNSQKETSFQFDYTESLFTDPSKLYSDFLDWTIDIQDVIDKKKVIEWSQLSSRDPENYLYIENYISDRLNEIWLEDFQFNSLYNFKNSWRNSIPLSFTIADKQKIVSFLTTVWENGFLWNNTNIKKQWWIYNVNVELVFDIK